MVVKINIQGEVLPVNSGLIFQRLAAVATQHPDSLEKSLEYELSHFPPALFASSSCLRESQKSQLSDSLWSMLDQPVVTLPPTLKFVLDGGSLLHKIPWKKGSSYQSIINQYVNFVHSSYGGAVIVFDGYTQSSIKDMVHRSRNKGHVGVEISFTLDMNLTVTKDIFLLSNKNKQHFIDMFSAELVKSGCKVIHSQSDADVLIAETTVECSKEQPTVLVADDTDLLVLLLHKVENTCQKVFLMPQQHGKKGKMKLWCIQEAQSKLSSDILQNILFIHAFTGCDSTSGIKGIEKSSLLKKLAGNTTLKDCAAKMSVSQVTTCVYITNHCSKGFIFSMVRTFSRTTTLPWPQEHLFLPRFKQCI